VPNAQQLRKSLGEGGPPKVAEIESLSMGAPISVEATRFHPKCHQDIQALCRPKHIVLCKEKVGLSMMTRVLSDSSTPTLRPCASSRLERNPTFFAYKIAPALATGNTVVSRPPRNPHFRFSLAPLFKRSRFPEEPSTSFREGFYWKSFDSSYGYPFDFLSRVLLRPGKKVMEAAAQTN